MPHAHFFSVPTYAVIGNPVQHSYSPTIHQAFALQTGRTLQYLKIEAAVADFITAVQQFQQQGGKGLNVTAPFKQQAWQLADERSPRAEVAAAVNTLIFSMEGKISGDNTDGVGLITDLTRNHQWQIKDKKLLIVGAGGAARGILPALLAAQPQSICIANRTAAAATALAQQMAHLGTVYGCGLAALQDTFDGIIHATSASLSGTALTLPAHLIHAQTFCYDLTYANQLTPFLQWAHAAGTSHLADGMGMLVEQAAESFYLWHGIRPQTEPVLNLLRKKL